MQAASGSVYKNFLDGLITVYKNEGFKGLYKGVGPTTQRAAILTAAQLSSYDHVKNTILNRDLLSEGIVLHFAASVLAGFVSAAATSPVDVIKTRVMNQGGIKIYSGTVDCFAKILKSEGPMGFYKGFIPNWVRIGPHTVVTMMVFEQLRKFAGITPV
eukprot:TRINITY_DN1860_c0_g1_i3.p1 TRINITY_DN1860_c0_g1~~TRINITY_DN1860_c0_g1_i3.p1  ORF type:complete len:158 (-),score=28.60 TRINITY_DN1860_c0_g1_i3:79-552(-)